jgi:hypothetical protein
MQSETVETVEMIFDPVVGREIPIARKWDGVPAWIKTYFIALDGYGNWARGETLTEAKAQLLKRAGAKSHAHFSKYGMIAYMLRQDERSPEPWVSGNGGIYNYADQFNGDYSIIEEIKPAKR